MAKIPEKTITQNVFNRMQEMSTTASEDGQPLSGQALIDWFWVKTADLWRPQLKLHRKRTLEDTEFNLNE